MKKNKRLIGSPSQDPFSWILIAGFSLLFIGFILPVMMQYPLDALGIIFIGIGAAYILGIDVSFKSEFSKYALLLMLIGAILIVVGAFQSSVSTFFNVYVYGIPIFAIFIGLFLIFVMPAFFRTNKPKSSKQPTTIIYDTNQYGRSGSSTHWLIVIVIIGIAILLFFYFGGSFSNNTITMPGTTTTSASSSSSGFSLLGAGIGAGVLPLALIGLDMIPGVDFVTIPITIAAVVGGGLLGGIIGAHL